MRHLLVSDANTGSAWLSDDTVHRRHVLVSDTVSVGWA